MKKGIRIIIFLLLLVGLASPAGSENISFDTVGQYVTFGVFPREKDGKDRTPIEWLILDYDGESNKALLLSRYGLFPMYYHGKSAKVSWETCDLRAFLNSDFLGAAFSPEEQSAILETHVDNSSAQGYSKWKAIRSHDTDDRIFLLSYAEADKYLCVDFHGNTKAARMIPTAYALSFRPHTYSEYKAEDGSITADWWLRSPGSSPRNAAYIFGAGSARQADVHSTDICVRPALWLDLGAYALNMQ